MNTIVTVYIPTANRLRLLKRALSSVRAQSYRWLDIVVIDDASSDNTVSYLAELSKQDKRVRYLLNEKRMGACHSRNKAILTARGEFITGLDDDDYVEETYIQTLVEAWCQIASGTVALYPQGYLRIAEDVYRDIVKPTSCSASDLFLQNWIGNQVFTQTKTLMDIGGFDEDFPAWQDLDCWFRLLRDQRECAELVPQAVYVVDISHGEERISQNKRGNVIRAFEIFSTKHSATVTEKRLLKFQLAYYGIGKISLTDLLVRIWYKPSWLNIRLSVNSYLKSIISTLKKSLPNAE